MAPRVLLVLDTSAAWSRGIVRGFSAVAHERGWMLLHYAPSANLSWLLGEWPPNAVVLGPAQRDITPALPTGCAFVAVNVDRCSEGIASVCLDEEAIAEAALAHLLARGLENLTTFRFDETPFATVRERRFRDSALALGARVLDGWWQDGAVPPRSQEEPAALTAWLRALPKPCGVFACCDTWARVVARYAQVMGLRVPEDLAIVGADNDAVECELSAPALSSVAVPWRSVGEHAARLVQSALEGKSIAGQRVLVSPSQLVVRRSSDTFAIKDALVAAAVTWIHEHADRRLTVPQVTRAVSTTRQRLERRFRATLGRTVMGEVRRAHVEVAKGLLATTKLKLSDVAKRSGFTNSALLSVAFRREVGLPPGAYRRRAAGASTTED